MRIKDVEKLTGLTAKSIRYYESKNLISIARNEDNDYREYTEEDVEQLKLIKIYRYLQFSIEEITTLLQSDETTIKDALLTKADNFDKEKDILDNKKDLCKALAKDYQNKKQFISEYTDTIEFLESDEYEKFNKELTNYSTPDLTTTIIKSLIFIAPVLNLFINIHSNNTEVLLLNSILAIIGTVLLTITIVYYIYKVSNNKKQVTTKNKKTKWLALIMLLGIIFTFINFIIISILIEKILLPNDFLFYEHKSSSQFLFILLLVPFSLLIESTSIVLKISKLSIEEMEKMNDLIYIWNKLKKYKTPVIIVWLLALYCSITNLTCVTANKIIYYSPLHPLGIEYKYEDVDYIKTGFGTKNFSLYEHNKKGNFYYTIHIDNKESIFHVPTPNSNITKYEEDSYLELEEFDQALMLLNIKKEASDKGYEKCQLDKQYVDRFIRIIHN